MIGIENLNEVNVALSKLAVLIVKAVRGGETISFSSVLPFVAALPMAVEGIELVPGEINDLDSEETQILLETTLAELQELGIVQPDLAMPFIEAAAKFTDGIQGIIKAAQDLPEE